MTHTIATTQKPRRLLLCLPGDLHQPLSIPTPNHIHNVDKWIHCFLKDFLFIRTRELAQRLRVWTSVQFPASIPGSWHSVLSIISQELGARGRNLTPLTSFEHLYSCEYTHVQTHSHTHIKIENTFLKHFKLHLFYLLYRYHMCLCVCQSTCVGVRRQLREVKSLLLPACRREPNSGCQASWRFKLVASPVVSTRVAIFDSKKSFQEP